MTASSFPEFITTRRRELELTLGDVAAGLGVSPITVSNWSNGNATPKPENLVALAELLEVPPAELAAMAGVSLKSTAGGVNLLPPDLEGIAAEAAPAPVGKAELSEPIAETRLAEPDLLDKPPEVEPVDESAAEVPIPVDPDAEAAGTEPPAEQPAEPEPETVSPEPVEEAPDAVPAFVAAETPAAEQAPAAKERPGIRRPGGRAPAAAERQVTTLPLTYIEDPKQLMRYRIRWALTVVILAIMFIVLLWASRELLSALSEVKQAVTPGGIGGS